MTQTNGVIASVQILTSDIASASQVSTNTTDIANLQQLYNDLQQSKPVPVTSLPTTGQQQGVIYRLAGTTSYADYMWNGSGWVMMAEYNNAIDNKPTTESDNLVTSGGVAEGINIIGANISAIDASYNLVNNITIGRGIDENGIISTNSARAIFIVRIAEGSTTTSISTDVPIVSWNYYSGVPNIKTGSNFMPDRVVTPVTTRTVRSGAKYLIIMLNISNGNPTYIYVKQEGNFVNRIDVESTIINVSQLYPTGGTSGTNVYTQTEARQKVPVELRKKGTILIYNYASFVRIEQYYDEYTNESDWLYGDSWRNFDTSDFVDLCRLRNVESFSTRVDALGFTPTPLRKACTLVSYKLTNGDAFLEMFIGSTWSLQDQYWIRFVDSATVASLSTLLSELENKTGYDDNILMVSASYAIEANQNNFVVPQNNVSNVPSKRKKGYIKVTGFDAFVIFYNEVFQRLTSYYTQDGVDTEITIPSEACLFRVYKKNQEVVAESTPFTLKVYYSNEWDRYQEYADSLVLSNTRMILRNLNRTKISSATNTPDTTYKTLTLGCLTDIHNDVWCASKFVELNKALKEHVDDVWGLGDYVNSSLDDLYSLDSISGFGDIIKIIGNHDAYDKWPNPNIVAESVDYTDFLASDISGWGVQYTANKCYFYKDYPNANIRVIALDYMHWDEVNDTNGQKAWLVATLESARIEGYHVIIAVHSPIISEYSGSILSYDRFAFHFLDEDGTINVGWDGNSVLEIVDNFQQQGGTFICYMTGHRHFDFIGAYENYPNQIVLNQCCTSGITAGNDTEWSTDCEWALRFNYYSFDYKSKFIRVYQYGNSFNRNMQHKISALLTYDVNKQNKLLY